MELNSAETSVVILGAWNPSILQPNWLVKEVFKIPEGKQSPMTMEFALIPGAPLKFKLKDITFVPLRDRIVLQAAETTKESLDNVEQTAINILNLLPHTPIGGFGENFEFFEDNPSGELIKIFELKDSLADRVIVPFETISTTVTTSIKIEECTLNLNRILSGGRLKFKFNFHYGVTSANDAASKLNNTFFNNLKFAVTLLNTYNAVPADLREVLNGRVH